MAEVSKDLGLTRWTLANWVRRDRLSKKKKPVATTASPRTSETPEQKLARLERENARLQKENDQLKMDREILKKAAAFFAKENE